MKRSKIKDYLIKGKKWQVVKLSLILFFIGGDFAFSQNENEIRLQEIPAEINSALKVEDYEKAAQLKKESKLRQEIVTALKLENYEKAAQLKQEIEANKSGSKGQIIALEKELENAINNEDYSRAKELKIQIETLRSGKPINSTSQNNSRTNFKTHSESDNSTSSYPIPQFNYQVFLYNSGQLVSLEKATGELKTSGGGFVVASSTSSYVIQGASSNIRLKGGNHKFVVKTVPGMDPSESIKLVKLEVRGRNTQNRYADQYKSVASPYHAETSKQTDQDINLSFRSVNPKEGVFEISTPNLSNGEYAFMYINKLYAFGID